MERLIVVAIILFGISPSFASTSLEANKWCQYTSETGKVVFSGQCRVNWGINGVSPCSGKLQPDSYGERYYLTFSPKSEARVEMLCKGGATVNGKPATVTQLKKQGKLIYRITTKAGEVYEFEPVKEEPANERASLGVLQKISGVLKALISDNTKWLEFHIDGAVHVDSMKVGASKWRFTDREILA